MKNEILIYNTLHDFISSIGLNVPKQTDFLIIKTEEIYKRESYKSPVFRANYFSILIITKGKGSYTLDNQTFKTKNRTVYFTNPGHFKSFIVEIPYEGFIISMSESFLKENIGSNAFKEFPFLLAEIVPPCYLEKKEFLDIINLAEQLFNEYNSKSIYKDKIIANLLVILLLKLKMFSWENYNPLKEGKKDSQIVTEFKRNLEKHFRDLIENNVDYLYQVKDFAELQFLHPNYFNTVIKNKTSKTVGRLINEKLINEAKALLNNSNFSVKEIAYQLKFTDPAHFNKNFKKLTGLTPLQFRKK